MDCNCTEKISSLIDGELSTSEAREMERHLLTCRGCQEAKADFLMLRSQISDFPVSFRPAAQPATLDRILGREKSPAKTSWKWVFNPAVTAFASLLLVGTVIAFLVYPKLKHSVTPAELARTEIQKANQNSSGPTPAGENRRPNIPKTNGPKKTPPASGTEKSKTPNKRRAPLALEPQPDNIAAIPNDAQDNSRVRSADAETMTAIHFQKSELLLRSFRNVRLSRAGTAELSYERKRAQELVYQNMLLRREADTAGDSQVASLLESLEPILLDIANLPAKPRQADVRAIKDRVERKNIVVLLQVNSTALARALD